MSDSGIAVIVRALNAISELDACSLGDMEAAAARMMREAPTMLAREMADRVPYAGSELRKKLSRETLANGRRLALVAAIVIQPPKASECGATIDRERFERNFAVFEAGKMLGPARGYEADPPAAPLTEAERERVLAKGRSFLEAFPPRPAFAPIPPAPVAPQPGLAVHEIDNVIDPQDNEAAVIFENAIAELDEVDR
jgi:hypothetical protein